MSVIVVAHIHPHPGKTDQVIAGFDAVADLVHAEAGCELYAAHTDGDRVIMVERWTTRADLDAHATGAALVKLGELNEGLTARPSDVWVLENVAMGDPVKGTIQ